MNVHWIEMFLTTSWVQLLGGDQSVSGKLNTRPGREQQKRGPGRYLGQGPFCSCPCCLSLRRLLDIPAGPSAPHQPCLAGSVGLVLGGMKDEGS
jgi:hypothetical protein